MTTFASRPIIQKTGKSIRGKWSKAQKEFVSRACADGCIACIRLGFYGVECEWHHARSGSMSMRPPHEQGLPLCPTHHRNGPDAIHQSRERFEALMGATEQELVAGVQKRFGWEL